ncbi:MAG: hypothetical protein ACI8WM_002809 [Burkholderiaceae bacterium]|jgi:hypothetical protein
MSNSITTRNFNPLTVGDKVFSASDGSVSTITEEDIKSKVLHVGDIIVSDDGTVVSMKDGGDQDILADGRNLTGNKDDDAGQKKSGFWDKLFSFANSKQEKELVFDGVLQSNGGNTITMPSSDRTQIDEEGRMHATALLYSDKLWVGGKKLSVEDLQNYVVNHPEDVRVVDACKWFIDNKDELYRMRANLRNMQDEPTLNKSNLRTYIENPMETCKYKNTASIPKGSTNKPGELAAVTINATIKTGLTTPGAVRSAEKSAESAAPLIISSNVGRIGARTNLDLAKTADILAAALSTASDNLESSIKIGIRKANELSVRSLGNR